MICNRGMWGIYTHSSRNTLRHSALSSKKLLVGFAAQVDGPRFRSSDKISSSSLVYIKEP